MTTISPSKVKEFDPTSLEKIAYNSVKTIPTREPNDQYRLGYSIWLWLTERKGTLEQAVKTAGARMLIAEKDAVKIISDELKKEGIEV
ncbi:MAG: hypothetical protein AB1600_01645 [Bacteroidota bacterium]